MPTAAEIATIVQGEVLGDATLLLTGLAAADSAHANDLGVVGGATLGIGGALTLGGILLGLYSRPESQPGTTVQWTP